uniref:Uncharacterized protein n=1 Tax=Anabas testudineus TaxID=64144 RepID=A0A3Q1JCY2_ANATE
MSYMHVLISTCFYVDSGPTGYTRGFASPVSCKNSKMSHENVQSVKCF